MFEGFCRLASTSSNVTFPLRPRATKYISLDSCLKLLVNPRISAVVDLLVLGGGGFVSQLTVLEASGFSLCTLANIILSFRSSSLSSDPW